MTKFEYIARFQALTGPAAAAFYDGKEWPKAIHACLRWAETLDGKWRIAAMGTINEMIQMREREHAKIDEAFSREVRRIVGRPSDWI